MVAILAFAAIAMGSDRPGSDQLRPNSHLDATAAFAAALDTACRQGRPLVLPKGEYHFYREHGFERNLFLSNSDVANPRRIAILIEGKKHVRIVGNGSQLVFHDRIIPIAVLGCQDVQIDGLTIDWERPLMSQGTVVASGPTGFTLRIDAAKYPYRVENGRLLFTDRTWKRAPWAFMEFDPKTRGVRAGTGDGGFTDGQWWSAQVSEPGTGLVRYDFPCKRFPVVGDVLIARHGVRDHAGTFVADSKDVEFSNMAYRHTSGLGVLSQYTENVTFRNVDVAPDPNSDRLFAGHDDGFHFSNCKGRILVDGCRFDGLMDDPINVHGTAVAVVGKPAPNALRCRFMQEQSVGFRFANAGDTVSFIDHETLASLSTGVVRSVTKLTDDEFEIAFDSPVPESLQIRDALENLTWTPSFTLRNSTFGPVRARGLLVTTPKKVLIEHNLFRSSGSAILIAGDCNGWYESGAVKDVTIRHNRFENCNSSAYQFCEAVISIDPEIPKLGPKPFHSGIRIEDNTFLLSDAPVLWAKSVDGLRFERNTLRWDGAMPARQPDGNALTFLGCKNVLVERNSLDSKVSRKLLVDGVDRASIDVRW